LAARLVDHGRDHSGERGGVEALPDAATQALGDQQVALGVHASQHLARPGDLLAVLAEVPEAREHRADAVEVAGDRVGAALDAPQQRGVLAVELVPALGPARVVLALGARVARVGLHRSPRGGDLGILVRRAGPGLLLPARGRLSLVEPAPQT